MVAGKWIVGLEPQTPLEDAARRVLTVRLEAVRDAIPEVLQAAGEDPEHVHQLRVGTRRARAALDIFAPCLPARVYRRARRRLRRIRKGAGDARDGDVFFAELLNWSRGRPARERPGLLFLTGYVTAQRQAAQERLAEIGKGYPFFFDRFLAATLTAVRASEAPDQLLFIDLARPVLRNLVHDLEKATAGDLESAASLHGVRILGKRLRYAMEIFAPCFPAVFHDCLYPAVEQMQEVLGRANDSAVAHVRLESVLAPLSSLPPRDAKRLRPGIEELLRHHEQRLRDERAGFHEWWRRQWQAGAAPTLARLLTAPETSRPASRATGTEPNGPTFAFHGGEPAAEATG